jgi:integral membrane protein (TIGR01906 family)
MSNWIGKVIAWIVTLAVPVALVMGAVRILLTPAYLVFEYNTPGFPPDPYGFSKEDRLLWAGYALEYLINDAGIDFLGDLRFPDGQVVPAQSCKYMDDCTKLYNDRELKHMLDVKNVVQAALIVWYASLVILIALGLWAWFRGSWAQFRKGLSRGGWLTVVLIAAILGFVLVAFGVIFVAFHKVFFESGTWTFLFSDTLIRLFPERFWRDTFLMVGIIAGGVGALLGYLFREQKTPGAQ